MVLVVSDSKNIAVRNPLSRLRSKARIALCSFALVVSCDASAGLLDQLANAANSALAVYGRDNPVDPSRKLDAFEQETAVKELLLLAIGNTFADFEQSRAFRRGGRTTLALPDEWKLLRAQAIAHGKLPDIASTEQALRHVLNDSALALLPAVRARVIREVAQLRLEAPAQILYGGDAAATQLLHRKSAERLTLQLRDLVLRNLDAGDVAEHLADLEPQIAQYIASGSVEKLFQGLRRFERAIRSDPLQRSTELLRRAFA